MYTYLEVITVNGCSGSSSLFAFVDHLREFQNKGFPFDLFNSTNGNIRKHITKHSCKINYREHVIIVIYVYQHLFVTETKEKQSNKRQTHVRVLRTFHVFILLSLFPIYVLLAKSSPFLPPPPKKKNII